jgi:hypothetical protein
MRGVSIGRPHRPGISGFNGFDGLSQDLAESGL